jgi:hypothetical protein
MGEDIKLQLQRWNDHLRLLVECVVFETILKKARAHVA